MSVLRQLEWINILDDLPPYNVAVLVSGGIVGKGWHKAWRVKTDHAGDHWLLASEESLHRFEGEPRSWITHWADVKTP